MPVYFIQAGDAAIKIGWAEKPATRLNKIKADNHLPTKLLGVVAGDAKVERALHQKFSHLHMRGEWFRVGHDLLAYIAEHAVAAPPGRENRQRLYTDPHRPRPIATVDDLVEALGGTYAVARLTGAKPPSISNWRERGKVPAQRFPVISQECERLGLRTPMAVFGWAAA